MPAGSFLRGPGTVTNAGTIIGTNAADGAVQFASNASASRLIVDPGAVFSGKIISLANSTNVIELASSASAGRLSGFDGSSITNFATLAFDSGAAWTVAGNSAASGLGSIAITGFASGDTIDLTGFVAVSKTFASNTLVLTNAGNAHATLHIQGTFTTSSFSLASDGTTGTDIFLGTTAASALVYGQTIDEAGIVAASETVTAGMMTLFNGGGTAVGTISVGTSLSTGDFTLTIRRLRRHRRDRGLGVRHLYQRRHAAGQPDNHRERPARSPTPSASGKAVSGPSGTAWTLTNYGMVSETGARRRRRQLRLCRHDHQCGGGSITGAERRHRPAGGGSVTNQSGGTISAATTPSTRRAPRHTVVNAGVIAGNDTSERAAGVYLGEGGTVTNQSGGTISGYFGVDAIMTRSQW